MKTLFIHLSNGKWGAVKVDLVFQEDAAEELIRCFMNHFGATGYQLCEETLLEVYPDVSPEDIFPLNF